MSVHSAISFRIFKEVSKQAFALKESSFLIMYMLKLVLGLLKSRSMEVREKQRKIEFISATNTSCRKEPITVS
jgi:hypothetical protein